MRQSLRPTPLVLFLFLLLLVPQYQVSTTQGMLAASSPGLEGSSEAIVSRTYGFLRTVKVVDAGATSTITVRWLILACQLAATWLAAGLYAWMLTALLGMKSPSKLVGRMVLAVVTLAFLAAIGTSKAYWGYAFDRPETLGAVSEVASVESLIPFRTEFGDGDEVVLLFDQQRSSRGFSSAENPSALDPLTERILLSLEERGLLPEEHSNEVDSLAGLMSAIEASELLVGRKNDPGTSRLVEGFAVDTMTRDGRRLVLLGLTGSKPVSNDHHVFYEMALEETAESPGLAYLDGHRSYYDVAGLEGMTWRHLWGIYAWLGLILGTIGVTLALLGRTLWSGMRVTREAASTSV